MGAAAPIPKENGRKMHPSNACKAGVPSFVYRQDGHELSYMIVFCILPGIRKNVKWEKMEKVPLPSGSGTCCRKNQNLE